MNDFHIDDLGPRDFESSEIYIHVYDIPDVIKRQEILAKMRAQAKKVKATRAFDDFTKTFNRMERQFKQEEKEKLKATENNTLVEHYTNFGTDQYDRLGCGMWVADTNGIYHETNLGRVYACRHPILPAERLKNMETGEEYVVIAFFRRGRWEQLKVKKTVIASANKIVQLADYGVAVTSENAKELVRFLSEVEMINDDYIKVKNSTSKLGWHGDDFLPYESDIVFDGNSRFKALYESVCEGGLFDVWLDHVKKIRQRGRFETQIMLAASFASSLIRLTGQLPFFVDLYGETEGGKTVTLMLAASVWASPKDSKYIGDFKTTDVALEARADMLNNLPVILDDTSKVSQRISTNFEAVIYDLCSGKGKSRSNKELGINRENHWSCCFLTNGERPLSSYVIQGGAMNRILEVECLPDVFEDPSGTAELLKKNYGFAGRLFVEAVSQLGDQVQSIYQGFRQALEDESVMQKQVDALAVILTADRIAQESIFHDGILISIAEAKRVLMSHDDLSDNERCYQYICDKIAMNHNRFDSDANIEQWGSLEDGYAVFYAQAFADLCKTGGYSKKSFLNWASRKGLVKMDKEGNKTVPKRMDGKLMRCVWLFVGDQDDNGFVDLDDENMPFL